MQKTVLHLARRSAPDIGGVESHLSELAPELEKLGYHSVIINEQMLLGNSSWKPFHKLAIWYGIFRRLHLIWQVQVIHVHDVFWWLLPFLPVLWWKKMFATFHGYESVSGPNFRQKFWHQLAAKLTRGNICIGAFHKLWYGVQASVISYGATTVPIQKLQKGKLKKVIFIGRLEVDTGFCAYIEAVLIAKTSGVQIVLDVFGEGSQRVWAENFCKQHKLQVRFFGFVQNCRLFLPNYSCAFVSQYLAILESLAVGVPVLAYATTQFKEDYLRMTPFKSWIQIANSPEKIVFAHRRLKQPPHEAKIWSREQTWQKLAKQYVQLWETK